MASYFRHEQALVECQDIGEGTRVWAFAHILPGAKVGRDCNICDHTFIENNVILGDRVTVKCGVQLWDGVRLENDVFVGPNATFTNDNFPRSRQYLNSEQLLYTVVKKGASIGANATILPGITIGERAMVGAGSVVTHNVPPNAIVAGNPAKIISYAGAPREQAAPSGSKGTASTTETGVRGVVVFNLPYVEDMRGGLTFGEVPAHVPFEVKRFFLVYNVPTKEVRGEHAHKQLHQYLVCVSGALSVIVDDGTNSREIKLDTPTRGLYIPPMVWAVQYKHTKDAALLVLASDRYDPADYIREYSEFTQLVNGGAA